MFSDRPAKFRSYDTVVGIAEKARQKAGLSTEINVNLPDYINGFLRLRVGLPIEVRIFLKGEHNARAFVEFKKDENIVLNVEDATWFQAERNFPDAKFVMAHEVGHIIMHRHDALAYSDAPYFFIRSLTDEERVEPQANWFADAFIAPISMLEGIRNVYDVADLLNVPETCARRQLERMLDDQRRRGLITGFDDMCSQCGGLTVDGSGQCMSCRGCK
ncbi:ImmA/IrrE family metallo-endopeptidase [Methylobacterium sp. SyP6R]|uniref:ImmA/IrrE family metallo-endopeptidase n=1 Tax=Methylobacterium sp. SyP6R TaxID=2718876 RepID=UPI001F453F41|nr:ImmA/IrrE family metallo-endopeptidase [Methylobacterium sp. SyP6R]MCF4129036.1 ImmA/IrrE family metallo-endopeptidase [Methylobacterium sp. SyP6R]